MEDKLTELGETLQTQSAEYFDIVFSTAFREPLKYTPPSCLFSSFICIVLSLFWSFPHHKTNYDNLIQV